MKTLSSKVKVAKDSGYIQIFSNIKPHVVTISDLGLILYWKRNANLAAQCGRLRLFTFPVGAEFGVDPVAVVVASSSPMSLVDQEEWKVQGPLRVGVEAMARCFFGWADESSATVQKTWLKMCRENDVEANSSLLRENDVEADSCLLRENGVEADSS
ncbi:hypothetical protein CDAR_59901 [Caerostris darwini]|uniref:Uncharacterized protein n=1 Tax=Caerostris darwini TaxID=1538125 RepID=A0AAV4RLZ4_9ARAC|nr:hypothetical protein CDAR_59901 [Caerostris darwini]